MSKVTKLSTTSKPVLASNSEKALAFATGNKVVNEKRGFFAPEGYRRLTINLREDLHKKLRLTAIEEDCTATDIIERLLVRELIGNQV